MHESPILPDPFAALQPAPQRDWPVERQLAFLRALFPGGDVAAAAARVGASKHAVTRFRQRLGRRSAFSRAWRHAVSQANMDALATRVLRRGGLDAGQLARIDAACHGAEKVRLALALVQYSRRGAARRAAGKHPADG